MDILKELKNLAERLDEAGIDYALCGGFALAVYARPRATLDIDVLIEAETLERTVRAVADLGFIFRAEPMEFQNGNVRIHHLTKIDEMDHEALDLDLLMVTPGNIKAW